jgi:hypothetical protein
MAWPLVELWARCSPPPCSHPAQLHFTVIGTDCHVVLEHVAVAVHPTQHHTRNLQALHTAMSPPREWSGAMQPKSSSRVLGAPVRWNYDTSGLSQGSLPVNYAPSSEHWLPTLWAWEEHMGVC